jgi:hypothetical protein
VGQPIHRAVLYLVGAAKSGLIWVTFVNIMSASGNIQGTEIKEADERRRNIKKE